MKQLLVIFTLLFSGVYSFGQQEEDSAGVYLRKEFIEGNDTLQYRIMYPLNFDQSRKYPLVVFLHGAGERGGDNESQLVHGGNLFRDSLGKYPAIVIFPQCPQSEYWANVSRPDEGGRSRNFTFHTEEKPGKSLRLVISLVNQILDTSFIDEKRFYLSGLSMGGFGVWELLWRMPEKIASALPICGGGPINHAKSMIDIPIWAFHGVDDPVVHPRFSLNMVKAVQRAGGKAKISYYPDVGHNSWDRAFKETDFLNWIFSKVKD